MGFSIAAGVMALGSQALGAFIVPGDMPFLTSALLKDLMAAFNESRGASIVYPTTLAREQRNPGPRRFFPLLASLDGLGGAKHLLATSIDSQKPVPVVNEGPSQSRPPKGTGIKSGSVSDPITVRRACSAQADEFAEIGHAPQSVSFCEVMVDRQSLLGWLTTVSTKAPQLREADVTKLVLAEKEKNGSVGIAKIVTLVQAKDPVGTKNLIR
jgi:hypothetical protein